MPSSNNLKKIEDLNQHKPLNSNLNHLLAIRVNLKHLSIKPSPRRKLKVQEQRASHSNNSNLEMRWLNYKTKWRTSRKREGNYERSLISSASNSNRPTIGRSSSREISRMSKVNSRDIRISRRRSRNWKNSCKQRFKVKQMVTIWWGLKWSQVLLLPHEVLLSSF